MAQLRAGLAGVQEVHRRNFGPVITSSPEERAGWLEEAAALARKVF